MVWYGLERDLPYDMRTFLSLLPLGLFIYKRHDVEHVATKVKGNGRRLQRLPCLARSFLVPTFQHLTNRSGASPLSDMRLLLREARDPLSAHFEETTLQASEAETKQKNHGCDPEPLPLSLLSFGGTPQVTCTSLSVRGLCRS